MRTVSPVSTAPASGASSPASRLRRVDLPLPLAPTMPMRSSRRSMQSKSRTTVRPPKPLVTPLHSMVFLPRRLARAFSSKVLFSAGPLWAFKAS